MFIQHMMGILHHPKEEWSQIRKEHYSISHIFIQQVSILAAIPAVAMFIGTTQVGWSIAGSEYVKLGVASALPAAIAFYFAMWVAVGFRLLVTSDIYCNANVFIRACCFIPIAMV